MEPVFRVFPELRENIEPALHPVCEAAFLFVRVKSQPGDRGEPFPVVPMDGAHRSRVFIAHFKPDVVAFHDYELQRLLPERERLLEHIRIFRRAHAVDAEIKHPRGLTRRGGHLVEYLRNDLPVCPAGTDHENIVIIAGDCVAAQLFRAGRR